MIRELGGNVIVETENNPEKNSDMTSETGSANTTLVNRKQPFVTQTHTGNIIKTYLK
jgi:hypothetical protein